MNDNDNDVARANALELEIAEIADLQTARSELISSGDSLAPSERLQRGSLDNRLYELGQQAGRTP